MKIQYASDLHIEFSSNREYLKRYPLKVIGDILVLAGDIVPFALMDRYLDFFDYLSDHFKITYWVPGNHEYYYFDLKEKCGFLNEKIKSNVFLVNNTSILQQNTRFIFSTLWSKISYQCQNKIKTCLNDFHLIKFNGDRFTIEQYNQLHENDLKYIKHELKKVHEGNTIVVTHHVPTYINYPEFYRGDKLNEAFATELSDLIEESSIDYWVYGHHHTNIPAFNIGKTHLLTNQLGYVLRNEHLDFIATKCIE